jgi:N-acyl-L-homoserine lactone synthetase
MRIVVIEGAGPNDARLRRVFEHRRHIFVDRLGWNALDRPDGLERDALDGPEAVYILVVDANGDLRGSARLLPTTGPHLFSTALAAFPGPDYAAAADVWEWSRHAPGHPNWSPDINQIARFTLHLGVCEVALRRGVRALVALTETRLLRHARRLGWACDPIGPVMPFTEGEAVAVRNPVDSAVLARLRRATGMTHDVLNVQASAA